MPPLQGEVWDIRFGEGYERPGVVVSRNELNCGDLILVIPCSGSQIERRSVYQNHVLLDKGKGGLTYRSVAQAHLIQPVDLKFFIKRRGRLDPEDLGEILQALAWSIDLYPE